MRKCGVERSEMNEQGDYILSLYTFFACVEADTKGMCVSFVNQEKIMDHHKERERETLVSVCLTELSDGLANKRSKTICR